MPGLCCGAVQYVLLQSAQAFRCAWLWRLLWFHRRALRLFRWRPVLAGEHREPVRVLRALPGGAEVHHLVLGKAGCASRARPQEVLPQEAAGVAAVRAPVLHLRLSREGRHELPDQEPPRPLRRLAGRPGLPRGVRGRLAREPAVVRGPGQGHDHDAGGQLPGLPGVEVQRRPGPPPALCCRRAWPALDPGGQRGPHQEQRRLLHRGSTA
mmetsp:Transcript_9596/g.29812  ORF Transcript_9596/g.29812 Transcript_9596/m.29812 type:complete len:210 (-) Transcript_9596:1010-1639(-)